MKTVLFGLLMMLSFSANSLMIACHTYDDIHTMYNNLTDDRMSDYLFDNNYCYVLDTDLFEYSVVRELGDYTLIRIWAEMPFDMYVFSQSVEK